jgi:hypothetical protein
MPIGLQRKRIAMTKPLLSRRTILKGVGAAMALPVLDAMLTGSGVLPATTAAGAPIASAGAAGAAATGGAPLRMAYMFLPNGVNYEAWKVKGEGAAYELSKSLQPLAKVRDKFSVLTGLTLNGARALGDGPGDHARSAAAFLTAAHPRKTSGKDIKLGISVDQVMANAVGTRTRLPSLELGLERAKLSGDCDSGYSCAYVGNISWRSETTPMPTEIDPALLFDRLFGSSAERDAAEAARNGRRRKSILDFVSEDAKKLQSKLGSGDLQKLDEFQTSIREIERRIEIAKAADAKALLQKPTMDRPMGIPKNVQDHMRLMIDVLVLAYQMDITRISSILVARDGSERQFPDIGVKEGHHGLSHHSGDQKKIEAIQKIDAFHMEQLAYFIEKLGSVKEAGGKTLLDNTALLCGAGISDGNKHNHEDLPLILAGGGAGNLTPGRNIVYPRDTPLANLYLSMMDMMGVRQERFADSTGRLQKLKA